jgi:hypothetical protein
VNKALGMRHLERLSDLARYVYRVLDRKLCFSLQPLGERVASNIRGEVEWKSSRLTRIEYRKDAGVLKTGGYLDFPSEALRPKDRYEVRPEHFDRHGTAGLDIAGEVHCGHATATELVLEGVAVHARIGEAPRAGQSPEFRW